MTKHGTLICIRRGTQCELDKCKLEIGELGFTTDTHMLFIGSDIGNLQLATGKHKHPPLETEKCTDVNE
jgi:hypothetical protein